MAESADGNGIYGTLAEVDVQFLRDAARELRAKLRRTVSEVLASAKILAAARRRLTRANWRGWLEKEAQIPPRSAQRLVNVGVAFAGVNEDTLLNFTPTALYTLAESGIPQAVREYAVLQARDGEEVTAAKVNEWVRSFAASERDQTAAPLKLARPLAEDAPPVDPFTDPAEVYAVENWKLLCDLVGTDGTVHLSASTDTEAEGMTVVSAYCIDEGNRRSATGDTVESVVLKLTDTRRTKECAACGTVKPLDEFCRRADMPDGREYRCKACERARVRAYADAKRAS